MRKIINRILVPVNFNSQTLLVLHKAIQVANEFDCDLHLIYVQVRAPVFSFFQKWLPGLRPGSSLAYATRRMDELKENCRARLKNGLHISTSIRPGNWYSQVKDLIIAEHIDLVVLPQDIKRFSGSLFPGININQLVQQTSCPVLAITSRFDASHLHNIVVPVNDFLPIRKLTMATFLARPFNGVVHLTGRQGEQEGPGEKKNGKCLRLAYQLLKEYTNVKVYCSSHNGRAMAAEALEYARAVQADLIVVNPGKESVINGFFSRWFGKSLYRKAGIPVMTIAPAQ